MSLPSGPRSNIEIKARLESYESALKTARRLGARDEGEERQTDLYYRVPEGRLKLRRSSRHGDQLVLYFRADRAAPRRSDYEVVALRPGHRVEELLERMLGLEVVVRKLRHLLLIDDTRIHLDRVEELGLFLEFEAVFAADDRLAAAAARRQVDLLMQEFDVTGDRLVPRSYRELVLAAGKP